MAAAVLLVTHEGELGTSKEGSMLSCYTFCFLLECGVRRLTRISCMCIKYRVGFSMWLMLHGSIKTGGRSKFKNTLTVAEPLQPVVPCQLPNICLI